MRKTFTKTLITLALLITLAAPALAGDVQFPPAPDKGGDAAAQSPVPQLVIDLVLALLAKR